MGTIASANLDVANTLVNAEVGRIFAPDAPETWKQYCKPVPCDGTSLEIVAVDGMPNVRERIAGEALQRGNLRAYRKNLVYRQWEGTLDMERILVDNDKSGAVGMRVAEWGPVMATYTEKIVVDAIMANSITGYDGQAGLSNSHPNVNGTTADNLQTGALDYSMMRTVQQAMALLKTETGIPLNIRANALLVGPVLARKARELAGPLRPQTVNNASGFDTGTVVAVFGQNNYDGQDLMVIETPYITGNEYVFWDLSKPIKPWVLAQYTQFRVLSQLTEASDSVYNRDTYSWSIQGDVSPCPFAWQLSHGSVTA